MTEEEEDEDADEEEERISSEKVIKLTRHGEPCRLSTFLTVDGDADEDEEEAEKQAVRLIRLADYTEADGAELMAMDLFAQQLPDGAVLSIIALVTEDTSGVRTMTTVVEEFYGDGDVGDVAVDTVAFPHAGDVHIVRGWGRGTFGSPHAVVVDFSEIRGHNERASNAQLGKTEEEAYGEYNKAYVDGKPSALAAFAMHRTAETSAAKGHVSWPLAWAGDLDLAAFGVSWDDLGAVVDGPYLVFHRQAADGPEDGVDAATIVMVPVPGAAAGLHPIVFAIENSGVGVGIDQDADGEKERGRTCLRGESNRIVLSIEQMKVVFAPTADEVDEETVSGLLRIALPYSRHVSAPRHAVPCGCRWETAVAVVSADPFVAHAAPIAAIAVPTAPARIDELPLVRRVPCAAFSPPPTVLGIADDAVILLDGGEVVDVSTEEEDESWNFADLDENEDDLPEIEVSDDIVAIDKIRLVRVESIAWSPRDSLQAQLANVACEIVTLALPLSVTLTLLALRIVGGRRAADRAVNGVESVSLLGQPVGEPTDDIASYLAPPLAPLTALAVVAGVALAPLALCREAPNIVALLAVVVALAGIPRGSGAAENMRKAGKAV